MKTVNCNHSTMIFPKTAYISLSQLSDADLGKYIRMILEYGFNDTEPEVSPLENAMLAPIFDFIKNSKDSYDKVSESRKKAANARWNKQMYANDAYASKCMQTDANDALNNNINNNIDKKKDRKIDRKEEEENESSSLSSEQLSIYQPLYDKFKEVLGMCIYSVEDIGKYASQILKCEYTIQDMIDVIECKGKEWINDDNMRQWIRPQTLFKPEKFGQYLFHAKNSSTYQNKDLQARAAKALESFDFGEVVGVY